jgi:hypothetical protein
MNASCLSWPYIYQTFSAIKCHGFIDIGISSYDCNRLPIVDYFLNWIMSFNWIMSLFLVTDHFLFLAQRLFVLQAGSLLVVAALLLAHQEYFSTQMDHTEGTQAADQIHGLVAALNTISEPISIRVYAVCAHAP